MTVGIGRYKDTNGTWQDVGSVATSVLAGKADKTTTGKSVLDYGAFGLGVSDDTAAINAALADTTAKTLVWPAGTYRVTGSLNLNAMSNRKIVGAGKGVVTINATTGTSTAVFLASSGAALTNFEMSGVTIDGGFTSSVSVNGVQVTNGSKVGVVDCGFKNIANAGVLYQGLNSGGGTPDSYVRFSDFDGIGLSNGTTGFGIYFKDASSRCAAFRNTMKNIVGGMGVGLSGSAGTGYATQCLVSGNHITMAASTTGFEPIGIATGCDYTLVENNIIPFSRDNGISVTSNFNNVVGNTVINAFNHGIALGGMGSVVTGNIVRNPGQEDAQAYAAVSLAGASYCTIEGNVFVDDQATHTMSHVIKGVSSGGYNRIGINSASGYSVSYVNGYSAGQLTTTDFVVDTTTNTDGLTFSKAHFGTVYGPDASTALIIGSSARLTGVNYLGSNTYGSAQGNVSSNAPSTRPAWNFVAVTGQVADIWQAVLRNTTTNAETVLAKMLPSGALAAPSVQQTGVVTRTSGYTASAADSYVICNGTFGVQLPAVVLGQRLVVKNTGTGTITVTPGTGTIDGAANTTLTTQYQCKTFFSDGTNWFIED